MRTQHSRRIPTPPATPSSYDTVDSGTAGFGLGHALQRRRAEQQRAMLAHGHPPSGQSSPVRQWLGMRMVRLGTAIAGDRPAGHASAPAAPGRFRIS